MPRTKDLMLFVIVIVFLMMAIFQTLSFSSAKSDAIADVSFNTADLNVSSGAIYEENQIDRKSIIDRLRNAIKDDDSVLLVAPVDVVSTSTPDENREVIIGEVGIQTCSTYESAIGYLKDWPRKDLSLQTVEGARVIVYSREVAIIPETTATTSTSTEIVKIQYETVVSYLLQLPLQPTQSGQYCLESDLVGVTTEGSLLFNSDAMTYRGYGPAYLVGYARDGFPVYGNYTGETDVCGGYEEDGVYRYSVSSDKDYILGCYSATPQTFLE